MYNVLEFDHFTFDPINGEDAVQKSQFLRRFQQAVAAYTRSQERDRSQDLWLRAQSAVRSAGLPTQCPPGNIQVPNPILLAVVNYCHATPRGLSLSSLYEIEEAWEFYRDVSSQTRAA